MAKQGYLWSLPEIWYPDFQTCYLKTCKQRVFWGEKNNSNYNAFIVFQKETKFVTMWYPGQQTQPVSKASSHLYGISSVN